MRKMRKLWILAVVLGAASMAQADAISFSVADDGDGVITCTSDFNALTQTLTIDGDHNIFDDGHILKIGRASCRERV